LYFRAIVDELRPPGRYPEVARQLDKEPDTAALYHRLAQADPPAAARIEPGNRRRILRALEVTVGSGRPFSSYGPGLAAYPAREDHWRLAGLWLPRPVVGERIRRRLERMVEEGLVDEVQKLRTAGMARTARQALGYKEVLEHLEGRWSLDQAVTEADRRTRAFARRQRVWWRRDPRITWYGSADNPLAVIAQILGNWREP
jgi:tRNA dimethylallyltransferase